MRFFLLVAFVSVLPFPAHASVVITEIMYDLPGSDSKHEWIEVKNEGESVNLFEWKLYEGESNHKLVPHTGDGTVPSGAYAVIADNPATFLSDYPGFSGILFDVALSGGLNNTNGETLTLRDADLLDRDVVTYSPTNGGAGDGNSLHKADSGWRALLPTPGAGPGTESATQTAVEPKEEPEAPKPAPPTKEIAVIPLEEPTATETPNEVGAETTTIIAATTPEEEPKPQVAEAPAEESEERSVVEPETQVAAVAQSSAQSGNDSWWWFLALGALIILGVGGVFLVKKKPAAPSS